MYIYKQSSKCNDVNTWWSSMFYAYFVSHALEKNMANTSSDIDVTKCF